MHPEYQTVYYKQSISSMQIEEVLRRFRAEELLNASAKIDPLGKLLLSGEYENEQQVELAFSIARKVVGKDAVSNVRPQEIKQKDWEISASKGFAKFIDDLAKKYNMSVYIEQNEKNNLIDVSDRGLDGITQFASNSSEPTANATQFYFQVAVGVANSQSEKDGKKRILIVGHTDDTGDTHHNATLAEQRAHSVGKIFEVAGIESDRIYYQGAGESLPVADNRTEEGRARNRRVEIVDLSDEYAFRQYLLSRRPNTTFYRPAGRISETKKSSTDENNGVRHAAFNNQPVDEKIDAQIAGRTTSSEKISVSGSKQPNKGKFPVGYIDFGGVPATSFNATVNFGNMQKTKQGFFSFISDAHAMDMGPISSCYTDRPRNAGAVKSLKDGKRYATNEYLPGLNGRSWHDTVSGNLIVLNNVAVLSDGTTPANVPNLKVYVGYNPDVNSNPKPDVSVNPEVNAYQGSNGLLYRVFTQGERGIQCMDVLIPSDGSPAAKAGKVIYGGNGSEFVSDFKPIMIR